MKNVSENQTIEVSQANENLIIDCKKLLSELSASCFNRERELGALRTEEKELYSQLKRMRKMEKHLGPDAGISNLMPPICKSWFTSVLLIESHREAYIKAKAIYAEKKSELEKIKDKYAAQEEVAKSLNS